MGKALCVLGMHRSGTSLLMQMLSECGVHAGDSKRLSVAGVSDNPSGYWEHSAFRKVNDRILEALGGSWKDVPSFSDHWLERPEVALLRDKARTLVEEFRDSDVWGWKDPRNSLTLPFWKSIVPDLRSIVAFRNPVQAAMSMQARRTAGNFAFSVEFSASLDLWLAYYDQIFMTLDENEDVPFVHYETLVYRPVAELSRVCDLLGLSVDREVLAKGASRAESAFFRNTISDELLKFANLSERHTHMYAKLCERAGPNFQAMAHDGGHQQRRTRTDVSLLYKKLLEAWKASEPSGTTSPKTRQHKESNSTASAATITSPL